MELFSIKNKNLDPIELVPFEKEKEIQELVESNTESLFDLEFISSEFNVILKTRTLE